MSGRNPSYGNSPDMEGRRYLTFSLRTLFILLTALAVWLGVVVNRAREQREAVEAIEALGGAVDYDTAGLVGSAWLRRTLGDDVFRDAWKVGFDYLSRPSPPESDMLKSLPHLKRLRKLKVVFVPREISAATIDELEAALPNCEVIPIGH